MGALKVRERERERERERWGGGGAGAGKEEKIHSRSARTKTLSHGCTKDRRKIDGSIEDKGGTE